MRIAISFLVTLLVSAALSSSATAGRQGGRPEAARIKSLRAAKARQSARPTAAIGPRDAALLPQTVVPRGTPGVEVKATLAHGLVQVGVTVPKATLVGGQATGAFVHFPQADGKWGSVALKPELTNSGSLVRFSGEATGQAPDISKVAVSVQTPGANNNLQHWGDDHPVQR